MIRSMVAAALVAAACTWALPAVAQDAPMASEQTLGDVSYLNGGVGEDEVQHIKGLMKDYSLRLAFSRAGRPRAEYVASVAVTVTDAKGKVVFELASAGPYLLLKLPDGKYSVTATYENQSVTRPLVAGKGTQPVNFVWK